MSAGKRLSASDNPLTVTDTRRYAATLRRLLTSLDREVVDTAIIGDGEGDLLHAERKEVDRVREFLDGRVLVSLQLDGGRRRGLALLDAFGNEFLAAQHDDSPSGAGSAVGPADASIDTVGERVGGASIPPGVPSTIPEGGTA